MLKEYRQHTDFSALAVERAQIGIPPLPLNAEQTSQLCELLKNPPPGDARNFNDVITRSHPPGVDEAAYVKAGFLTAIA